MGGLALVLGGAACVRVYSPRQRDSADAAAPRVDPWSVPPSLFSSALLRYNARAESYNARAESREPCARAFGTNHAKPAKTLAPLPAASPGPSSVMVYSHALETEGRVKLLARDYERDKALEFRQIKG
jgi:hypothetical protein